MTGMRILTSSTPSLPKQNHLAYCHILDEIQDLSTLFVYFWSSRASRYCQHLLYELNKDIPQIGVGAFPRKKAFSLEDFLEALDRYM